MFDDEKLKTIVAFLKWHDGEAMSLTDAERVLKMIRDKPFSVVSPDQAALAGFEVRLRSTLIEKFNLMQR